MVPKIEAAPKRAPRICTVAVDVHLVLRVTWSAGPRVGKEDVVDLSPILLASKVFRRLREDEELFKTVHRVAGGVAVAWGDNDEIDLSAIAIQNLAEETLTAPDMKKLIADYGMTEGSLAASLGYSRRQIVSFVNDEAPIPRVVSLACRYIALKHPLAQKNELKLQPRLAPALTANTASTSVVNQVRPRVPVYKDARYSYTTVQHAY